MLLGYANPITTLDGRSIDPMHLRVKDSKFFETLLPEFHRLARRNVSFVIHPYEDSPKVTEDSPNLEAHLITADAAEHARRGDFDRFVQSRVNFLMPMIMALCGCTVTVELDNLATGADSDEDSEEFA
jgi:hypothetical protein